MTRDEVGVAAACLSPLLMGGYLCFYAEVTPPSLEGPAKPGILTGFLRKVRPALSVPAALPSLEGGKRYALVINGDTEPRHVDNVRDYVDYLHDRLHVAGGNIRIVCSKCLIQDDKSTLQGLSQALADLSARMTAADVLYVYTTGHGDRDEFTSFLVMDNEEEIGQADLARRVYRLPAGKIHYYGDQCYSGGFVDEFNRQAPAGKTIVAMSAAAKDGTCNCQDFTPALLAAYAKGSDDRDAFLAALANARKSDPEYTDGLLLASTGSPSPIGRGQGEGESEAPDFRAMDIMLGASVALSEFKGQVVLLDFWATWCPPCRRELPDLVKLYRSHKDEKFTVLGVTEDEPEKDVRKVIVSEKIPYPVLTVEERPSGYETDFIPYTLLIDCRGRIQKKYSGATELKEFEQDIAQAIASCS